MKKYINVLMLLAVVVVLIVIQNLKQMRYYPRKMITYLILASLPL